MMESVDKLREACKGHMYTGCDDIPHLICDAFGIGHRPYNWGSVLIPVCDAIEAEIEHDYMRLPVDADGVPIRPGDKLIAYNERFDVEGIGDGIVIYRNEDDELGELFNPAATVHVKPRTLEDVLADFAADVENDRNTIETARKYADEIRELLGGDAQ